MPFTGDFLGLLDEEQRRGLEAGSLTPPGERVGVVIEIEGAGADQIAATPREAAQIILS